MFVRYLVVGLFFVSTLCFGHGSHDPAEKYEELESLLAATFVELQTESAAIADPAKIIFADLEGRVYSVQKTAIAEALGRSIELNLIKHCSQSHCHHHCQEKIPTWKIWAGRVLRVITAPVYGAKEMALQLPPTLSELAGEFGVLPAVAIITLWAPYTFVTEAIESAVMGGWHWACQFFQAVYWGPVTFVMLNMNSIKEALLTRSPELGVCRKLWHVFKDRFKEWQFSRAMAKGFKTETRLPNVPLHPDGYVFPNLNATESMTKLYKFIDSQLEAAQESGKVGYWHRVSARYQAGRLKALINSLRHARYIIAHQKNRAQYAQWIASAELALRECLFEFWQMASGKSTVAALKASITRHSETVLAFRHGNCALAVAVPEAEQLFQLSAPANNVVSAAPPVNGQ